MGVMSWAAARAQRALEQKSTRVYLEHTCHMLTGYGPWNDAVLWPIHRSGMSAVRRQLRSPHVDVRAVQERACLSALAAVIGADARLLEERLLWYGAVDTFDTAVREYARRVTPSGLRLLTQLDVEDLGRCFTYATHMTVAEVGPLLGMNEALWYRWQKDRLEWMSERSGRHQREISQSAVFRHPDPNEAVLRLAHASNDDDAD